jgi:hypothetical protein
MRSAPVLLIVAGILFAGQFATAQVVAPQQPSSITSPQEQVDKSQLQQTQLLTVNSLSASPSTVEGQFYYLRWGDVTDVPANNVTVMFADCLPQEFPTGSTQLMMPKEELIQSFPVGIPSSTNYGAFTSWISVVYNINPTAQAASIGLICASGAGTEHARAEYVIYDQNVRITINNIVKQFIKIQNGQIINKTAVQNNVPALPPPSATTTGNETGATVTTPSQGTQQPNQEGQQATNDNNATTGGGGRGESPAGGEQQQQVESGSTTPSLTHDSNGDDNSIPSDSGSSSPSSSSNSRCPNGYHRSPSGDCERVTDTRGMPRCPNGYHRSPDGDCERVR